MRIQQPPIANLSQITIDAALAMAGFAISGMSSIIMGGNKITGLGAPTTAGDAERYTLPGHKSFIRKDADETVNNSNVLQNDDHFVFALAANEVWAFFGMLRARVCAASDIKFTFTAPVGASGGFLDASAFYSAFPNSILAETAFATTRTNMPVGDIDGHIFVWGIVINGGNAGNLQFQWAQDSAVAENTTIKVDSYLELTRLV